MLSKPLSEYLPINANLSLGGVEFNGWGCCCWAPTLKEDDDAPIARVARVVVRRRWCWTIGSIVQCWLTNVIILKTFPLTSWTCCWVQHVTLLNCGAKIAANLKKSWSKTCFNLYWWARFNKFNTRFNENFHIKYDLSFIVNFFCIRDVVCVFLE